MRPDPPAGRWSPVALILMIALALTSTARAEHARISLDVASPDEKVTAHMDQTPPVEGRNPRPVLKAKAGDRIKIQWFFTNLYPHKTIENVVVHFYIAREQEVGQKEPPAVDENAVLETAFDMDFKPNGKAGARSSLTIDEPGVYLIRVESLQTQSDHEHFAAIDLVIEEK